MYLCIYALTYARSFQAKNNKMSYELYFGFYFIFFKNERIMMRKCLLKKKKLIINIRMALLEYVCGVWVCRLQTFSRDAQFRKIINCNTMQSIFIHINNSQLFFLLLL